MSKNKSSKPKKRYRKRPQRASVTRYKRLRGKSISKVGKKKQCV